MSSSVGTMIPTEWKNEKCSSHHQPVMNLTIAGLTHQCEGQLGSSTGAALTAMAETNICRAALGVDAIAPP